MIKHVFTTKFQRSTIVKMKTQQLLVSDKIRIFLTTRKPIKKLLFIFIISYSLTSLDFDNQIFSATEVLRIIKTLTKKPSIRLREETRAYEYFPDEPEEVGVYLVAFFIFWFFVEYTIYQFEKFDEKDSSNNDEDLSTYL
jgi:hypothetical protein